MFFFFIVLIISDIKQSNIGIYRDYRLELYPRLFVKKREDPFFLPFPYAHPHRRFVANTSKERRETSLWRSRIITVADWRESC